MHLIGLASKNPVKARAFRSGFGRMFPGRSVDIRQLPIASGVSAQPASDAETLAGARQRAEGVSEALPEAEFAVGIEGGIDDTGREMIAFAWVVIIAGSRQGESRSATFALPPKVAELVRGGLELGAADDLVFGRSRSKSKEGAVGLLTDNVIDRASLYEQAVALALIPFKSPHFQ